MYFSRSLGYLHCQRPIDLGRTILTEGDALVLMGQECVFVQLNGALDETVTSSPSQLQTSCDKYRSRKFPRTQWHRAMIILLLSCLAKVMRVSLVLE